MKVQIPFVHYLITRVLATNKVSPRRFLFLFPLNGSLIELLLNYLEVKHLDEVDQKKISTLRQGSKLFSEQGNNQSPGSRVAGSQRCSGQGLRHISTRLAQDNEPQDCQQGVLRHPQKRQRSLVMSCAWLQSRVHASLKLDDLFSVKRDAS